MITTFFGFKKGQTQTFTEDGKRIPVTKIAVDPCIVCGIVDKENMHRYILGIGSAKKLQKPVEGKLKKAGIEKKPRFFREVAVSALDEAVKIGSEVIFSDVFTQGDRVSVTGVSKGKGFAGVVKRHGFAGGPKTHGQSDKHRAPGSIGSGTTPGRVYKGKKMAGRMGTDTVTLQGLSVVSIDKEKNMVLVKGLVPGPVNGFVTISKHT